MKFRAESSSAFHRSILAFFIAVLTATGCAESPGRDAPGPFTTSEVATLPPLDEVSTIRDFARTESGAIWMVNSVAPFIVRQGDHGRLESSFGTNGGGPNELGFAPAVVLSASDTSITILDRGRRSMRTFHEDGWELHSVDVPDLGTEVPTDLGESLFGSPFKTVWLEGEGTVITSDYPTARAPGTAHLWNRRLVSIDDTGGLGELFDFREERDRLASRLAGAAILAPAPLWAVCPGGSLIVYLPFDEEVTWVETGAKVDVPTATGPLSRSELEVTVIGRLLRRSDAARMSEEEARSMLPEVMRQLEPELSTASPAYTEMVCDGSGRIWLQRFSVEDDWMGRAALADIIDPEHGDQQDVDLPPGFRLVTARGDTVFGVIRDEHDVEHLAAVLLHVPG